MFLLQKSKPPKFSLMLRLKSIIFYQNKPKIKLVLQKNKNCLSAGAMLPHPQWPLAELLDSQTQPLSSLQISDYTPDFRRLLLILPSFKILR